MGSFSGSTSRSSCRWRSTVYGVVGCRNLEGWRLLNALYMTVITLATVGFHEVHPLGPKRQVFCLVVWHVSSITYP